MYEAQLFDVTFARESNGRADNTLLKRLLAPEMGLPIFCICIAIFYIGLPLIAYFSELLRDEFVLLPAVAFVSIISMMIGASMPLVDSQFRYGAPRLAIDAKFFQGIVWILFFSFLVVTFYSAPSIPIVSAIKGASANVLSQERGDFLKGRQGAWIILLYLSTFLTTMLIPYSLVLLYNNRSSWRYPLALIYFLFCISSLQKALFLNLLLPLIIYSVEKGLLSWRKLVVLFILIIVLLIGFTALSLGNAGLSFANTDTLENYFSARYLPGSSLDYFLWRAFSVPVFTAVDTLVVFSEHFKNDGLMGSTSSLLSMILGVDRVNMERFVFEYQFGSWNEIANANAVFFVDAFVNFGWPGVFFISVFVGQMFRFFRLSTDVGFRSLWLLFAFMLFSASFIGMLFSNGFLYMIAHALFIKLKSSSLLAKNG